MKGANPAPRRVVFETRWFKYTTGPTLFMGSPVDMMKSPVIIGIEIAVSTAIAVLIGIFALHLPGTAASVGIVALIAAGIFAAMTVTFLPVWIFFLGEFICFPFMALVDKLKFNKGYNDIKEKSKDELLAENDDLVQKKIIFKSWDKKRIAHDIVIARMLGEDSAALSTGVPGERLWPW